MRKIQLYITTPINLVDLSPSNFCLANEIMEDWHPKFSVNLYKWFQEVYLLFLFVF